MVTYLLLTVLIVLGCWMTFGHNLASEHPVQLPRLDGALVAVAVLPASRRRGAIQARRSSTSCTRSSPGASGRFPFSRLVHAWSIPLQYVGRPYILYRAPLRAPSASGPRPAPKRRRPDLEPRATPGRSRSRTAGVRACFYAWSLLGPLGPDLQDHLGLSRVRAGDDGRRPRDARLAAARAARHAHRPLGGRRVFSACWPSRRCRSSRWPLWHDSLRGDADLRACCSASPARRSRSACRSSAAGTRRSARASRSASTASGMGGTVLAGLTAPRIADALGPRRAVLGRRGLVVVVGAVFWLVRPRRAVPPSRRAGVDAALRWRLPRGAAARGR